MNKEDQDSSSSSSSARKVSRKHLSGLKNITKLSTSKLNTYAGTDLSHVPLILGSARGARPDPNNAEYPKIDSTTGINEFMDPSDSSTKIKEQVNPRNTVKLSNQNRKSIYINKESKKSDPVKKSNSKQPNKKNRKAHSNNKRKSVYRITDKKCKVKEVQIKYTSRHKTQLDLINPVPVESKLTFVRNGIKITRPFHVGKVSDHFCEDTMRIKSDTNYIYCKVIENDIEQFALKFSKLAGRTYSEDTRSKALPKLKDLSESYGFTDAFDLNKYGMIIIQKDTKLGADIFLYYVLMMEMIANFLTLLRPDVWKKSQVTESYCNHLFYVYDDNKGKQRDSKNYHIYVNYHFFQLFFKTYVHRDFIEGCALEQNSNNSNGTNDQATSSE